MRKTPVYTGTKPKKNSCIIGELGRWQIYAIEMQEGSDWLNIKLVSKKPSKAKANFNLAWSFKEKRLANSRDNKVLNEIYEELEMLLVKFLLEYTPEKVSTFFDKN